MDERNEEKLEEKQEQRTIIETYDGDPDDLVFFQTAQDFEKRAKQKQAERIWGEPEDPAPNRESEEPEATGQAAKPEEPEAIGQAVKLEEPGTTGWAVKPEEPEATGQAAKPEEPEATGQAVKPAEPGTTGQTVRTEDSIIESTILQQAQTGMTAPEQPTAGRIPENRGIDPNDPHYINYEPDPYYEYGYGEEPEPIGMPGDKKGDGTGLGVASMVTGICSIVFGCCGFQYVLSLVAIILGICCLTRKHKSGTAKAFSIVGIVLGALILAVSILGIIFSFGFSTLSYFNI